MVQKKDTEVLPGWWCFHVSVLFFLQSRQGLPRWILSHFRQAPPLTDHTAAFKGLSEHQRQLCDFAFLSEHYNLWSFPPWWKAQLHSLPQPSLMIFQRHTQGLVAQCIIVGESSETHDASSVPFGTSSHTLPLLSLHDAHVPPVGKGRLVWIRRQRASDNGTVCASMTVWLAAPHKILFTAHTGEKLQQQSCPEGGKSADLATLRERPEGGSGTIIIILLPLIHCRYLYCSHSLWGIQPTGDNRLLVHKRMIKRQ